MISASEAKAQAQQTEIAKHKEALGKVESCILVSVKEGRTTAEFYIPNPFPIQFVMDHLRLLGYSVKTRAALDQRDRDSLIIDWD